MGNPLNYIPKIGIALVLICMFGIQIHQIQAAEEQVGAEKGEAEDKKAKRPKLEKCSGILKLIDAGSQSITVTVESEDGKSSDVVIKFNEETKIKVGKSSEIKDAQIGSNVKAQYDGETKLAKMIGIRKPKAKKEGGEEKEKKKKPKKDAEGDAKEDGM